MFHEELLKNFEWHNPRIQDKMGVFIKDMHSPTEEMDHFQPWFGERRSSAGSRPQKQSKLP